MNVNQHEPLWEKIQAFPLDDPQADLSFSQKLAMQQGWSRLFTKRAISEYKRFIFLCCISPTGASPPPIVDEVWHLHLTYTTNYWKAFCSGCLQQEIHHHPSKGGTTEKQKHNDWYASTLILYRDVFGEAAPTDIWPPVASEALPTLIPRLQYNKLYLKKAWLITLPFLLLVLLTGKPNPFALTGPQFLFFYLILIAAAFTTLFLVKLKKEALITEALDDADLSDVNAFQLARFVWGSRKTLETAVVDMVQKEILVVEHDGLLRFQLSKSMNSDAETNPVLAGLKRHYKEGDLLRMKHMEEQYQPDSNHHHGLQNLYQVIDNSDSWRHIIPGVVLAIGLLRFFQGMANDKPVVYLMLLLMVAAMVILSFAKKLSSLTILQEQVKRRYQNQQLEFATIQSQLVQFLFFGLTALASSYLFLHLDRTFQQQQSQLSSSGSDSSGCGSSGCGSSCGGGCGGCGGGD